MFRAISFLNDYISLVLSVVGKQINLCSWFIGIDGGFDNNEPEYEETHKIVILPNYVALPFPSVELPEKVSILI